MKFYEDPIYIKMCKQIPVDIVAQMREKQGLYSYICNRNNILTTSVRIAHYTCPLTYEHEVILWTQDQMQEIRGTDWTIFDGECAYFPFDMRKIKNGDKIPSKEQIMLMVIMQQKFNKTWNGEDWIKVVQE